MNLRPLERKALSEIRAYVDTHYGANITLDLLAGLHWQGGQVSFRKRRLHEAFSATFLQTIHEYLTRVRVENAKQLLQNTDQSVKAIAITVGYKGDSSFSQVFRKIVGCSPSVYRASLSI